MKKVTGCDLVNLMIKVLTGGKMEQALNNVTLVLYQCMTIASTDNDFIDNIFA